MPILQTKTPASKPLAELASKSEIPFVSLSDTDVSDHLCRHAALSAGVPRSFLAVANDQPASGCHASLPGKGKPVGVRFWLDNRNHATVFMKSTEAF